MQKLLAVVLTQAGASFIQHKADGCTKSVSATVSCSLHVCSQPSVSPWKKLLLPEPFAPTAGRRLHSVEVAGGQYISKMKKTPHPRRLSCY